MLHLFYNRIYVEINYYKVKYDYLLGNYQIQGEKMQKRIARHNLCWNNLLKSCSPVWNQSYQVLSIIEMTINSTRKCFEK